jgi:microcin C transport system permease protein
MLSLLIFIGEAVRDAFDPRKVWAGPAPATVAAASSPTTSARATGAQS